MTARWTTRAWPSRWWSGPARVHRLRVVVLLLVLASIAAG
jgi:hypothetical protein